MFHVDHKGAARRESFRQSLAGTTARDPGIRVREARRLAILERKRDGLDHEIHRIRKNLGLEERPA